MKTALFIISVLFSISLAAQQPTNFNKDIKPLLKANKFEEALPLLKKFYNERLTKSGTWSHKAISQRDKMHLASETIALTYYSKATSLVSSRYADSSIVWFNIMKNANHPKKGNVNSYIDKLNEIKIQAAELLRKKQEEERRVQEEERRVKEEQRRVKEEQRKERERLANEIVYFRFVEECIDFEYIYYQTKNLNPEKANEIYIDAKQQLGAIGLRNFPVNIDLTDVIEIDNYPFKKDSFGSCNTYFDNRKKSMKYYDVSYKTDGNILLEVSCFSQLDNQPHYYSLVPLQITDSSLIYIECTEKLQELRSNYFDILISLIDVANEQGRAKYEQERAMNAKKQRAQRLANNAANEKIMLDDKTLPYATTKLCDYRDGKFVACFQNNTVYRRHYNVWENSFGEWEAAGLKILIRNGKKIFNRDGIYNEAVIGSDGYVKIYNVSESTGERLSNKYYKYGYINGNRFDSQADSKEEAEDGFLFKGSAIEAIIIVSLCNSFK